MRVYDLLIVHKLDADDFFIYRVQRHCAEADLNFFSSVIARTEVGENVLIDYVNDQCHLLTQSANLQIGVPDELVAAIAKRLVEATCELIRK